MIDAKHSVLQEKVTKFETKCAKMALRLRKIVMAPPHFIKHGKREGPLTFRNCFQ